MADNKRMICVAVAVADAVRGKYLSGALNGAKRIAEWAGALGYETRLLTDEGAPVTIAILRETLEELLWPKRFDAAGERAPPPVTDRLIVYFAGHGLLRDAEEGLWLLSDWDREMRAVGLDALRKAFFRYPVTHLAIISDACLSLPADIDQAEIRPDPVLGKGPSPRTEPWYDRFVATQDGTTTFMVPADDPEDDRCVFSGVLLEGLWGLNDAAFSRRQPNAVTGNSLSVFLKEEVKRVSGLYSEPRMPSVGATFPDGDDIYFERNPALRPPRFADWPAPGALMDMGAGRPRGGGPLGFQFSVSGEIAGGDIVAAPAFDDLRAQLDASLPNRISGDARLAAFGAPVRALWQSPRLAADRLAQDWWGFALERGPGGYPAPAPLLVEYEDGRIVATVAMPHMATEIARDAHGAAAILMPIFYAPDTAGMALDAILKMEQGGLKIEAAADLAVELRQYKHADPVLGVISAYLYDTLGDMEIIRRIAYFYVEHGQPIPYDIALLGSLHGWRDGDLLRVAVPAVAPSPPRTELEARYGWTCQATPATEGVVGGQWPWMRQGWAFLDDPTDEESTLIAPELLDVIPFLTPGRFTTVELGGAEILAARFGLERKAQ
jgi:hypothetical protein